MGETLLITKLRTTHSSFIVTHNTAKGEALLLITKLTPTVHIQTICNTYNTAMGGALTTYNT